MNGDFKNSLREKKEILYYNNGKFVDGEWKYDLREGYITFYSFILVKKMKINWKSLKKRNEGLIFFYNIFF